MNEAGQCPDGKTVHVRPLVRRLIEWADGAAPHSGEDHPPGVLLDLEVDGVRCRLSRDRSARRRPVPQHPALSPREEQIARMVAEGYPNKTIAARLKISAWTVSTHLRRMFVKLDVSSRAAMVARLFEEGLIRDGPARRAELDPEESW